MSKPLYRRVLGEIATDLGPIIHVTKWSEDANIELSIGLGSAAWAYLVLTQEQALDLGAAIDNAVLKTETPAGEDTDDAS